MEIELRQFLQLARRWLWLLLLTAAVAGLTTRYVSSRHSPPASEYSARTVLLINPVQSTGRPNYSPTTYRDLLRARAVLAPVIVELNLPFGIDHLQRMLATDPATDPGSGSDYTDLLTVTVTDTDAVRAAAIANSVARHFTDYIAQQTIRLTSPTRTALAQQIDHTKQQIDETDQQIQALELGQQADDPAIQAQIDGLRLTLNQLQESYANLLLTAQTMDLNATAAQSQVIVVDAAEAPLVPNPEGRRIPAAPLAALAGFLVAAFVVILFEYLDNSVKAGTNVAELTGSPVLSVVPRISKLRNRSEQLFVVNRPSADAAEAVRLLRTNVEFASTVSKITSLAITSPGSGEGRSTVTANLAVAMAQVGLSVVIIDADLRHPSQHRIFRVPNELGLTTLLMHPDQPWLRAAVDVPLPNLALIPSGPLPPNPGDLLSLNRMRQLIAEISESVDIILLDTPPVLTASDSLVIATHVDGVVLVCRGGRTQLDALHRAASALQHGAARIVGTVINQHSGRDWRDYSASPSAYRPVSTPVSS